MNEGEINQQLQQETRRRTNMKLEAEVSLRESDNRTEALNSGTKNPE